MGAHYRNYFPPGSEVGMWKDPLKSIFPQMSFEMFQGVLKKLFESCVFENCFHFFSRMFLSTNTLQPNMLAKYNPKRSRSTTRIQESFGRGIISIISGTLKTTRNFLRGFMILVVNLGFDAKSFGSIWNTTLSMQSCS